MMPVPRHKSLSPDSRDGGRLEKSLNPPWGCRGLGTREASDADAIGIRSIQGMGRFGTGDGAALRRLVLQELPGATEGVGHLLGGHRAGEQHVALQREARHALDAAVAGLLVAGQDLALAV